MKTYYKVLRELNSCHGGSYTWKQFERTPTRKAIPCYEGWHFVNKNQLFHWIGYGLTVYEVTPTKDRKIVSEGNKFVCSSVTLGKKIGTLNKKVVSEIVQKVLAFAVKQWVKDNKVFNKKERNNLNAIADVIIGKGRTREKLAYLKREYNNKNKYDSVLRYKINDIIRCFTQASRLDSRYYAFYSNAATTVYNGNVILKSLRENGNV